MDAFIEKFLNLPPGYSQGRFDDRTYGVRVEISEDGRRRKFFAEELGGNDHVSFNFYLPDGSAPVIKPCEMPLEKVRDFVLGLQLHGAGAETKSSDG